MCGMGNDEKYDHMRARSRHTTSCKRFDFRRRQVETGLQSEHGEVRVSSPLSYGHDASNSRLFRSS